MKNGRMKYQLFLLTELFEVNWKFFLIMDYIILITGLYSINGF